MDQGNPAESFILNLHLLANNGKMKVKYFQIKLATNDREKI